MQKASFLAFTLILSLVGPSTRLQSREAQPINPAGFSLINGIERQAINDVHRLVKAVNNNVFNAIKTPKEPSRLAQKLDAFADSIFKWRGSKLEKLGKICAWCTIVLPLSAGIIELSDIGKEKPKMADYLSYAGYSLALFAAQTYLLEKAGINSKKELTIQNGIDFIKNYIQNKISQQNAKKAAIEKLQQNRDSALATITEDAIFQLKEQAATIAQLKKQLLEITQHSNHSNGTSVITYNQSVMPSGKEELPRHML